MHRYKSLGAIGCLALATALSVSTVGASETAPTEPPHFKIDHVGVFVDSETARSLLDSEFLRDEFAHTRGGSGTNSLGITGTAFYMSGARTYVEVVSDTKIPGIPTEQGDGMVAFNAEAPGSVDWIAARMRERHPESNPNVFLRHMNAGGNEIPYSHTVLFEYEAGHEGFGAWAMEYHYEFKRRVSQGRLAAGDITRKKDAPSVAHHPQKLFKDVIGVTVAVPATRRANLINLLLEMGYSVEEKDGRTVCTGKEGVIELIPRTDQAYSVTRIRLSLMRPHSGDRVYRFGPAAVLRFTEELEAVLEFE